MPVPCESKNHVKRRFEKNPASQLDHQDDRAADPQTSNITLSRRSFLGFAVAAAAATVTAVGLVGLFDPTQAFADTSAEKQAEADAVKEKMDAWNATLDKTSNDYYDAMDAHDQAVQKMNDAQSQIDAAAARQADLQAQLGARATAMYKDGPLGFLDVALGAKSFSEFSTTWSLIEDINNHDAALIAESKQNKADAQAAHDEYATQEQIAQQKLNEAAEAKATAEETMAAYQAQLDSLEAEVAQLIQEEQAAEQARLAALAAQQAASGTSTSSGGGNPGGYVPYDGSAFASIVAAAMSRLGCPYVWGATGPDTFDCSGLTSWCYLHGAGKTIPRGGNAQYSSAPMRLAVADAQPGDILWMMNHVGICIGGGQFIHAPHPGDVVHITNIAGYGWVGAARW
ncbi:MAG: NlpC/P60 family protein [Coriobacteriia bacterium]|nr:NlpC/P60 family protein [Coriobacteriia bacterium]